MPTGPVLVVDDYGPMGACVARKLQAAGVPARAVTDPIEACALAGEVQPALVIADVFMPERDGREVCRRLLRARRPVRTLLYSGASEPELAEDCLLAGAVGYRSKAYLFPGIVRDAALYLEPATPAVLTRGGRLGAGRTALVIEHVKEERERAVEALARDGFVPYAAASGRDGLLLCASVRPRAVVLDVALPDMRLSWMLPSLKATDAPPHVVASGSAERAREERSFYALGADDFFMKDVNAIDALAPRLASVMQRRVAPGVEVRAGALRLDRRGRGVWVDEALVARLTAAESRLLTALAAAHPHAVPWPELVLAVLQRPAEPSEESAAPAALRKRVESLHHALDGKGVVVALVKGYGLRLEFGPTRL